MIRLAEGPLAPQFWQLAEQWGIFGTKLYAQGRIYGLSGGPLEVWLLLAGERPVGALSRLGGVFCLAGGRAAPAQGPTQRPNQAPAQGLPQAQLQELSRFLPLVGGRCLEGPLPAVQQLAALLGGRLEQSWVLQAGRPPLGQLCPPAEEGAQPRRAGRLAPLCQLHQLATPGFPTGEGADAWLVDASWRQRHGFSDFYLLDGETGPVSTAGILFKGASRGILGAVATHPAHRGRGYGARVTAYALAQASAQGLEPWLCTANDLLEGFYRPLGFAPAGRWGRLWLPESQQNGE